MPSLDPPVGPLRRLDRTGVPLLLARLILGGMFVYMGTHKLADPIAFLKLVRMYHMLPETPPYFLNAVAIVLPWLEVFAGVALITGLCVRGAGLMTAIMLCVFTPAIVLRALRMVSETGQGFFQIRFDCGCGGGEVVIWKKVTENLLLLLLSVVAIASCSRRWCLSGLLDRHEQATAARPSSPRTSGVTQPIA